MQPYYEHAGITIYHGDCRDVIDTFPNNLVLCGDPPYGISLKTNYRERKRGALALCNDYPPVYGDDSPFDPSPFLRFETIALFGANYYADKLPSMPSWIVWDKVDDLESKREIGFNDQADCELIWTNTGLPARIIHHKWMGAMKDSERQDSRVHPTQKPVVLMKMVLNILVVKERVILDPFMGSGSTLIAAKELGCRAIGIEIEERYCEIAAKRLSQETLGI